MSHSLQAHYLDIEWVAPGHARKITVAPEPIEIEKEKDGTILAETQVFNGLCPWVGLRLGGELADAQPAFLKPDGSLQPMLRIEDSHGEHWWVQNDGWDSENKRHLSELHRSIGKFPILIGTQQLLINNVVDQLSRMDVEEYLHDFQHDLIWLVLGFGGATASVSSGGMFSEELVNALGNFAVASRSVLSNPARHVHEVQNESRPARLRPNVATFRQYLRNPTAQYFPGRSAEETADIADNRYLHYMVQACERMADQIAKSASRHADRFTERARTEAERSASYLSRTHSQIDPITFDNQLEELKNNLIKKLAQVTDYSDAIQEPGEQVIDWEFKPGQFYARRTDQMFYSQKDGSPASDDGIGISYSVLQVPTELAEAIQATQSFCDYYSIQGAGKAKKKFTNEGKPYREVIFKKIYRVTPTSSAIAKKESKRAHLEKNNWLSPLTTNERKELRQEARTAQSRERIYLKKVSQAQHTAKALTQCHAELRAQNLAFNKLGVGSSPAIPMGMRFSQNPAYNACQVAFAKVTALSQSNGFGVETLDAIERIGILHASALYERWCLVKIISILIEDFLFQPEKNWQERLIKAISGMPQSVDFQFRRSDIGMSALLEVQPVLSNGRRPDFRLRFFYDTAKSSTDSMHDSYRVSFLNRVNKSHPKPTGLVMDAKFRSKWRNGDLGRMLNCLVDEKKYGQENDRVFILHPAPKAILKSKSPLVWSKDCDYGQEAGNDHRKGVIYLAPGIGNSNPETNLRRLLVLHLQATFPEPVNPTPEETQIWQSHSFCVRCGKTHLPEDIKARRTGKGNLNWTLTCSDCGMQVTRTHCFGCKSGTLFKNGLNLTYHKTVADQITNVVCPHCGKYFDSDIHVKLKNY